jgi:O-antigen/teichoic acid export membrane protein
MNQPGKENNQGLLRHSIFLFAATQVANIANLLFQFVSGRQLPVDEYGVLGAMMSIFLIASTPLDALRTAMAHFTTRAVRSGDLAPIRWLVVNWSRRMAWLALILIVSGFLLRDQAAIFFQLESGTPFVFACGLVGLTLFMPLLGGVFQGLQSFYWMSASMHAWTVVRLGLVIVLTAISPTAISGLSAHALAAFFGIAVSYYGIYRLTRGCGNTAPVTGIGHFFIRSLLMLGCYAVLMNADLIFVKHLFTPEEAGLFARAATIGRAIIFLPIPIALVMFPKVITSGPSTRYSRITLLKAAGLVGLMVCGAAGVIVLMPRLPLWVLYGISDPDAETIRMLKLFVCGMAPLAMTFLLMNYEMAQHRFGLTWLLMACAILYIGGVACWHDTMEQVVWVLAGVSSLSAIGFAVAILFRAMRQHHQALPPTS